MLNLKFSFLASSRGGHKKNPYKNSSSRPERKIFLDSLEPFKADAHRH
jgi:hypothetical protein